MLKKAVLIILGLLVGFIYSVDVILDLLPSNWNKIVKEIESPDHRYVAILFIRDMGATTRESYQLSVYRRGADLLSRGGNIYVTYGEFDINWTADDELKVTSLTVEKVFKQEAVYKDVVIRYTTPGDP